MSGRERKMGGKRMGERERYKGKEGEEEEKRKKEGYKKGKAEEMIVDESTLGEE